MRKADNRRNRGINRLGRLLWVEAVAAALFVIALACSGPRVCAAGLAFDYIVPDADVRYLDASEISNMSLQTVCYAKNEIYARRGWIFRSKELDDYFRMQGWYYGRIYPEDFSDEILNSYEIANARLLQKREYELNPSGYALDQPGYTFDAVYYDLYGYGLSNGMYLDSGFVIPASDDRYLSEEELQGYSQQELCYARNEIYARHGRCFQSGELANYFEGKSWYFGYLSPQEFSTDVFNVYEKENVALLDRYEKQVYGEYRLDQPGYSYSGVRSVRDTLDYGEDYIFADSASRYLTDAEVAGMSAQSLCYAKNEIYARHGRLFDSKELRDYFNAKSWYYGWVKPEDFSSSVFNVYEVANIDLLRTYEYKYAPGGYQFYY